ncbi:VOC family protein [Arthrobacter sp. PAMC 25486]|uniref:VOC family protein n=1 Tax=Arthrobacter sp. PAMC 25486 TaxID=1494608 RepID=UPI0012FECC6F|nr:VOC family protein [Arthrobacter sp. PAMC 25486]
MKAETVTVGIPVRDLERSIAWYQSAFELGEPDQVPMEGLAEFNLGAFWLQLALVGSATARPFAHYWAGFRRGCPPNRTCDSHRIRLSMHHYPAVIRMFKGC